jgi:RNA polymerase sigma factor (sigma-70 family)
MARGTWQTVLGQVDRLYAEGTCTGYDDGHLLARFAAARDESNRAFAAILERHGPMVLEVCRRMLGDRHAAEDAFQATFLVLARRAGSLSVRPGGSLGPWLHEVAYRTARKARRASLRRASRERRTAERTGTVGAGQPAGLDVDESRLLHEEVARLPEKYRAAVVLCYFQGLTHDQAAETLRWPVGTVRGYLARARDLLRTRLIRRGVAPAVVMALSPQRPASATVAPALVAATVGAVPSRMTTDTVTVLAGSMVRGLAWAQGRRALAVLLAVVLGVGTAGVLGSYLRVSPLQAGPARPAVILAVPPAPKPAASHGVDRYGDPLPDGAISRLGTLRFYHGGHLTGVSFTRDGRSLVSFGADGLARIWDSSTGKEKLGIDLEKMPGARLFTLSFDGTLLASIEWNLDATLRLWDVGTGRELRQSPLPSARDFSALACSPDGKAVAAATVADSLFLWDAEKSGEPRRLGRDLLSYCGLAFSRDGRTVATASIDANPRVDAPTGAPDPGAREPERGSVRLWDVAKGTEILHIPVEGCYAHCVAFSPAGTTLAAGCSDATLRFYEASTGKELTRLHVQGEQQGCLAFSPDGRILASGTSPFTTFAGDGAAIHLWDVVRRKELRRFLAHDQSVSGLAFSPDGNTLASAGAEAAVRFWEVATGHEIKASAGHRSAVCCLVVSRADGTVITGGDDGTIRQWDPTTGRGLRRIGTDLGPVHDLAIALDGRNLLSASFDGTVRLWDLAGCRELHRLLEGDDMRRIGGLAFSPDGQRVSAGGKIFEVATGRELVTLRDGRGEPLFPSRSDFASFTPDARALISTDKRVVVFCDPTTGREVRQIAVRHDPIDSLALSPDGRFLAAYSRSDRTIRLWHVGSGREVAKLFGLEEISWGLAFSPDGRLLVTGSGGDFTNEDQSVRVWEVASGREVRRFDGHRAGVPAVAFFPDGHRIVSASADATAMVWDLARSRQTPRVPIDLDRLWSELDNDAARAYRAVWDLAADPDRSVPFLADHLKSVGGDDPDTDTSLGPIAKGETLRRLRAIAVLEKIGTPEARQVLERLATGFEGARETRDAKAALRRLP